MVGPRPIVQRVDRLQRLAVFESAARLGSFSAAGRELGLAQPAVTRQVRELERSLGVDLFDRGPNRVELTDSGRHLADSLDVNFAAIEFALDEIVQHEDVFVLATPPGFSQQLIVPQLDSLQRALGQRDLRLWLYDRESELGHGSFDAAIRLGTAPQEWPGMDSHPLFDEVVVPVATPAFAQQWNLDAHSTANDVLAAPLLHMDANDRPWMSWSDWLQSFELELTAGRPRVVFNNYPTVLQQAVASRGVALGWMRLVDEMVADGLLMIVGPAVASSRQYCVTWPSLRPRAAVSALVTWLERPA